jgi:hypothetical protein
MVRTVGGAEARWRTWRASRGSQTEIWFDPRTGERRHRQSIGCCRSGRLIVRRYDKSDWVDLYYTGSNLPLALDAGLRALVEVSWKNLELKTRRRLPTPVTDRPTWSWLARFVPAVDLVEPPTAAARNCSRYCRESRHCGCF